MSGWGGDAGSLTVRAWMFAMPLLLLGCDPQLDVHRGELGPFRIAGIGVEKTPEMDCPQAAAAVWSGLGPYHDESPLLTWSLDGVALGEGRGVEVCGTGLLALEVVSPDGGTAQKAQVRVGLPEVWTYEREAVEMLDSISLADRSAAVGEWVADTVELNAVARVRFVGLSSEYEVRWMTPADRGAALSLDTVSADVFPQNLPEDGDLSEAVGVSGCESGCVLGHLALAINGQGANGWAWVETAHGMSTGLLRHEGWLLDAALPEDTRWAAVTLRQDDTVERGISFEDWEALADIDGSLLNPGCGLAGHPFELDWIVEGRCTRPEVDGVRVLLEAW